MRAHRLLGLVVVGLWAVAAMRDGIEGWVRSTNVPNLVIEVSQEVRDRDGALLRAYPASDGRWRMGASVANVDPEFLRLLIRYEDKRFYGHSGVDLVALIRSAAQALRHGEIVSGGSTLSMQVARLLEESGTGSWPGKLRQMRLAWALEQRLSKQDILSLYLARAPYGGNLEGLRAASLAYFQKEPQRLTPAQAALLIALPQSPETRRPDRFPERAKVARDKVLARLRAAGALPPDTRVKQAFAVRRHPFPQHGPHLADRLRARMPQAVISTTLDRRLQAQLEKLAQQTVRQGAQRLSVAMLVADHQTGEILASVGSSGYGNNGRGGFNDMTQAQRSPGSTLKPLIYGMGFDQGLIHPETLIADRPAQFGSYAPQNFDGEFRGQVRVRQALQSSLNLPVVSLLDRMGPANLMTKLRQTGAEPALPGGQAGLAIALGGLGLSLHDLVQLYAGLATPHPKTLSPIPNASTPLAPVLSPRARWYVSDILREVPRPVMAQRRNVAFKTGTSYGHRDAWAIGYDGQHVVGVWMGRADGTPVPGAFGGDLAAPVLFQIFERLDEDGVPLPTAPRDALLLSASELPQPLRRFEARGAAVEGAPDMPQVAFPPDGARVRLRGGVVTVQIRNGVAPFTWMQDGQPVLTGSWDREAQLRPDGRGFMDVKVIDARGLSTGTTIFAD